MTLITYSSKVFCHLCGTKGRKWRRNNYCELCQNTSYKPIDLTDHWGPTPGFLVAGGPSIKAVDIRQLGQRGITSLGVNNVSSVTPCRAWCFSDPQEKFHSSLFFDPSILTFCPTPKLSKSVRIQLPDKSFAFTNTKVRDCPNTVGFSRSAAFHPDTFLTSEFAQWGMGGKQYSRGEPYRSLMVECKKCKGTGKCQTCGGYRKTDKMIRTKDDPVTFGNDCEDCQQKGKPTGCCRKCTVKEDGAYKGTGLDRPYTCIATILVGLRLLCHLGCKRIYLIGVDFSVPSKEVGYGFDEGASGNPSRYNKEDHMLASVRPTLEANGIEVLNTSPISQCTAFDKVEYKLAIRDCTRNVVGVSTRGWYSKKGLPDQRKAENVDIDL